jgi:G patch domain-containing protein 1
MLPKRSRAAYESDLHATETPFVLFGTPLAPLDSRFGDDGAYVPLHKQEVRDERGRRRLHGAFTGGWSAGYFNTVGSKEGWTPSTFVSSRQRRQAKNGDATAGQKPEDFMDEEDLADVAEAQTIQTADSFAGLGGAQQARRRNNDLANLIGSNGHTMGFSLLQKMGWRQGQGIGLKVRRAARLDDQGARNGKSAPVETHLFAPDDIPMVAISRKLDRNGLGNDSPRVTHDTTVKDVRPSRATARDGGNIQDAANLSSLPAFRKSRTKKLAVPLNLPSLGDGGSDSDDDPYSMGPRISFTRTLGGAKPKKGKTAANPAFASKLTFTSRQLAAVPTAPRACRDGRPPLAGFALSSEEESSTSPMSGATFPPPAIPPGWQSSIRSKEDRGRAGVTNDSSQDLTHNPKSRAAALGETQLPGKSVFDFLSAESRARIAAASGNTNLPQAKGEVPTGYAVSDAQRVKESLAALPPLEKETAIAAINRGDKSRGPYAEDEAKQSRYRVYLEHVAFGSDMPPKPENTTVKDYVKELAEFHSCANLFKPMSGLMATRFTASSNSRTWSDPMNRSSDPATSRASTTQQEDPSSAAARMGMYGRLTRSVVDFHPTRLLCKRFNVRPQFNDPSTSHGADEEAIPPTQDNHQHSRGPMAVHNPSPTTNPAVPPHVRPVQPSMGRSEASLDPDSHNAAGNGGQNLDAAPQRPADDVFKAVFGDSSEDEG